jgi:DnaJ family protein C protein 5
MDRSLSYEGESLYKALGLNKNATPSDIKKAYYKEALKCHPDKNPDNSEAAEKFRQINKANGVLRDERKKKVYDKLGSQGLAIADSAGLEVAETFAKYDNCCFKALFVTCFLITGCCFGCCCCCCLCCCCCGKIKPPNPEEDEQELYRYDQEADNTPDVKQSSSANSSSPIVLQPPSSSNQLPEDVPPSYDDNK